jgi:hypothetical protein
MKTIFYVNSAGIMAQWKGQIIGKDEKSISIRFSKGKALKFNLKELDIDFCLVTKTPIKNLGVCISKSSEAIQFDDNLKNVVLESTKENIEALWTGGSWKA